MSLTGHLKDLSFPDLLTLLSQQQKSGNLILSLGNKHASLGISKGKIFSVTVSKRTPETIVRDRLISQARIDKKIYNSLLVSSNKVNGNFYNLLVTKGYLQQNEAEFFYQIAAEDLVISLFNWKEGKYEFEVVNNPSRPLFCPFNLLIDFIILEGLRQTDELPDLRKKFPSDHIVFRQKKKDFENYDLGADLYIVRLINGARPVCDIKALLPYNDFRIYQGLSNLIKAGFIDIDGLPKEKPSKLPSIHDPIQTRSVHWMVPLMVVVFILAFFLNWDNFDSFSQNSNGYLTYRAFVIEKKVNLAKMDYQIIHFDEENLFNWIVKRGYLTHSESKVLK